MTQLDKLIKLNQYLLAEAPQAARRAARFGGDEPSQFRLFRSLVNVREAKAISRNFIELQDDYLRTAIALKGIADVRDLSPVRDDLYLWRGDITALAADAVVNAANSGLLGCFYPCHGCIDNAIHTYAGVQLRLACAELMRGQGHPEPTGQAKITPAFNLPSKHVIHTVGPVVEGGVTKSDCERLAACYRACLALADESGCESVAFCCISTGEFHFPSDRAARIAIETVREYKRETRGRIKVIFNVFKDEDEFIYHDLLG